MCSLGFGPRLLGLFKGLGKVGLLGFAFLLQGLILVIGVLECLLYFGYPLLILAADNLFGLQVLGRFLSGHLVHPCLLLGLGKFTPKGLNRSCATCNHAHSSA